MSAPTVGMRVLTVRQPWAWAIIRGGKDVENRSRNIAGAYRGPVAIHAGAREDTAARSHPEIQRLARDEWWTTPSDLLTGRFDQFRHIIGVVDLVDVHEAGDCFSRNLARVHRLYADDRPTFDALPDRGAGGLVGKIRYCSPWAEDHGQTWHLVLANPRPLVEPIPYRGGLGLRWLPADIAARVAEAVA